MVPVKKASGKKTYRRRPVPKELTKDQQLILQAIRLAGGRGAGLAERLHMGPSSVSEYRRGVRRIPPNERRRVEEFVGRGAQRDTPSLIRRLEDRFSGDEEITRLRADDAEFVTREWDPHYQDIVNRMKRDVDAVIARAEDDLGRLLELVRKLASAKAAPAPGRSGR